MLLNFGCFETTAPDLTDGSVVMECGIVEDDMVYDSEYQVWYYPLNLHVYNTNSYPFQIKGFIINVFNETGDKNLQNIEVFDQDDIKHLFSSPWVAKGLTDYELTLILPIRMISTHITVEIVADTEVGDRSIKSEYDFHQEKYMPEIVYGLGSWYFYEKGFQGKKDNEAMVSSICIVSQIYLNIDITDFELIFSNGDSYSHELYGILNDKHLALYLDSIDLDKYDFDPGEYSARVTFSDESYIEEAFNLEQQFTWENSFVPNYEFKDSVLYVYEKPYDYLTLIIYKKSGKDYEEVGELILGSTDEELANGIDILELKNDIEFKKGYTLSKLKGSYYVSLQCSNFSAEEKDGKKFGEFLDVVNIYTATYKITF